jgi:hypothetical protein
MWGRPSFFALGRGAAGPEGCGEYNTIIPMPSVLVFTSLKLTENSSDITCLSAKGESNTGVIAGIEKVRMSMMETNTYTQSRCASWE